MQSVHKTPANLSKYRLFRAHLATFASVVSCHYCKGIQFDRVSDSTLRKAHIGLRTPSAWRWLYFVWISACTILPVLGNQGFTTIYVGQHFEVREHDATIKYVFNGSTRVARISGSLSSNQRVQRLRVSAGWNLCSFAVTAPNALSQMRSLSASGGEGQGEVIAAAYKWNPGSSGWDLVSPTDTLTTGTVLWLHATTNATLRVTGTYSGPPTNATAPATGSFLPSAGLGVWPISTLNPQLSATLWSFRDPAERWRSSRPPPPLAQSNFPPVIGPGQAFYAQSLPPADLVLPDPALSLRFYHQDHLGSSAVLTDAQGNLVEETANYPFGHPRHQHQPKSIHEAYQFTQKERDQESGLEYFEARYLVSIPGRFAGVDALAGRPPGEWLSSPNRLNPYALCYNNPLAYSDSSGCFGIYVETDGTGHVGVQVKDDRGTENFDFGRYHGRYEYALFKGPNVLQQYEGDPHSKRFDSYQMFDFNVSKELDTAIAKTFREKFEAGKSEFPKEIADGLNNKEALASDQKYMGSDWGLTGPNCVTFSLGTLKESLQSVVESRASPELRKEAISVLDEIQKLEKGVSPAGVKGQLQLLPRFNGGKDVRETPIQWVPK